MQDSLATALRQEHASLTQDSPGSSTHLTSGALCVSPLLFGEYHENAFDTQQVDFSAQLKEGELVFVPF